jgi:thiamine transport system substrate-binding protein
VLSYTTSPAYHMVAENTERYQAAPFAEGHYLQVEVAGLIAASPEHALARQFLGFMITPGFQDAIPTMNWMLPVTKTSVPLPAAFGKLVSPAKTFLHSPEEVAANRRAWIDEWLAAVAQ